jgi:hypothetical protein
MTYLARAIKSLNPTAEFSYQDEDYSTINWVVLDGDAPTQKQIDDEIKNIKANEKALIKSNAIAKAALLTKLGITEDEAQLLLN